MVARVVVLGAGYAGMSAVRRLSRNDGVQVTLVNSRPEFVERIRLHQLLAGNHPALTPLSASVPRGVALEIARAESIDALAQQVSLSSDTTLEYDYLILAVGSCSAPSEINGAGQHAHTIDTVDAAAETRNVLRQLAPSSTITVVGGGLTGIETAAELAETGGHRIRLITRGTIGPSIGDKARNYVRRHFSDRGIDLIEHDAAQRITRNALVLASGRTVSSNLTIVTPAFGVPDLLRASGLAVGSTGALHIDTTLVSVKHPTIVGAGDAAILGEDPLRMSCQAALPLGVHAAETVLHLVAGEDPEPLRRKFSGQCISLGRRSAVFQFSNRIDQPRKHLILTGRAGAALKERICTSTLSFGHIGKFSYSWT